MTSHPCWGGGGLSALGCILCDECDPRNSHSDFLKGWRFLGSSTSPLVKVGRGQRSELNSHPAGLIGT